MAVSSEDCKIDWDGLPEWLPGCGSLSVDPLHYDRLLAESTNSPIRARKLELGSLDDQFEFMFDKFDKDRILSNALALLDCISSSILFSNLEYNA